MLNPKYLPLPNDREDLEQCSWGGKKKYGSPPKAIAFHDCFKWFNILITVFCLHGERKRGWLRLRLAVNGTLDMDHGKIRT